MYKCPTDTKIKLSAKGNTVRLNSCGKNGINIIKDVKIARLYQ